MKQDMGFREQLQGNLGAVAQEFDHQIASHNTWRKKEHNLDGSHANLTATSLEVSGRLTLGGPLMILDANVISPTQITANTNDYRPEGIDTAAVVRLSTDASRNLTGLYQFDTNAFRWLLLMNVGGQDIVLKHNVTSTAAYRFACFGSADVTLNSADSVWLCYDGDSANWRVIGV